MKIKKVILSLFCVVLLNAGFVAVRDIVPVNAAYAQQQADFSPEEFRTQVVAMLKDAVSAMNAEQKAALKEQLRQQIREYGKEYQEEMEKVIKEAGL